MSAWDGTLPTHVLHVGCNSQTDVCPNGVCGVSCAMASDLTGYLGTMPALKVASLGSDILRQGSLSLASQFTSATKGGVTMCGPLPIFSVDFIMNGFSGLSWASGAVNSATGLQRAISTLPVNPSDTGYYIVIGGSPLPGISVATALRPCGSSGKSVLVAFDGMCLHPGFQ